MFCVVELFCVADAAEFFAQMGAHMGVSVAFNSLLSLSLSLVSLFHFLCLLLPFSPAQEGDDDEEDGDFGGDEPDVE